MTTNLSACRESSTERDAALLAGVVAVIPALNEQGSSPPRVVVFLDADYSDHPGWLPARRGPQLCWG